MSKWTVGLYEDDHDQAFIGVEGGSICWVDDLTRGQATTIVKAHNALEQRVEGLEKQVDAAIVESLSDDATADSVRLVIRMAEEEKDDQLSETAN